MRRAGLVAFVVVALLLAAGHQPTHAQAGRNLEPISCVVTTSTATTVQAVGGACAATANFALYITDITMSTNAGGIAADSYSTLKYGTGTTCGTGTTIIWLAQTTAATQTTIVDNMATPLRLPLNTDLCWINSTAGTKSWVIRGYKGY